MEINERINEERTQLVGLINKLILKKNIRQKELAIRTGRSEKSISFIQNPLHPAQWTLMDLPVLIHLLGGEQIARVICGWIGMLPIPIPTGKVKVGHIMKEIGQLSAAIGTALEKGSISLEEKDIINKELLDVISAVKELGMNEVEKT